MNTSPVDTVGGLADALWQHYLQREPYLQLRNGVPVSQLPLGTLAEADEHAGFGKELLAQCDLLESTGLADDERLTLALLRDHAERLASSADLWAAQFPVAPYQLAGINTALTQVLPSASLAPEPDRYLTLVEDLARGIDVIADKVDEMRARGWALPRPAIPGAVATITGLRTFAAQVLTPGADLAADTAARLDRARDELVLVAFDRVLSRIDTADYRQAAPSAVGLWQYPGGPEAYLELARQSVTFSIDPAQVQQQGYEQMAALHEQKVKIRSDLGYPDEQDFIAHLQDTGRLHAKTADEVEASYLKHIRRIEPLIPKWFAVTPKAPYGVARLDAALEAGMSFGYYEAPNDLEPMGRYRYNGSGLDTRSQINAAALIFHELIPGHHFHIARETENQSLPKFRSQLPMYGAYNEGWAEYAASLADEMGLLDDPYDKYGHLVHQSFLTTRLVVDTGLNALGMSLDDARAYMREHCFESDTQIATETLRYSTDLPGQALGYRMGFGAFWQARRDAEAALGAAFDVRAFHEVVLGGGGRPMPVVADDVRRWVSETQR